VHVPTPFVERLATEEESKAGIAEPKMLNQSAAELQTAYRKRFGTRPSASFG
jgi:hypothetical protein